MRVKRDDFLMGKASGWRKVRWSIRGPGSQTHVSVERCILLPSLFSLSLPPLFLKSPSWGTLEPLFCLPSLCHNQPADRQTGAVIDDALSESDNIFSRSLKRDRAASVVGRSWPLSVFVRSICCVQSPLSRPPYQLRGG